MKSNFTQSLEQLNLTYAQIELIKQAFEKWVIGEDIHWNKKERLQYSLREADAMDYEFAVNNTKKQQRFALRGETK